MEWQKFSQECEKTLTKECNNIEYLLLGLRSEMGEIDGVLKKYIRGDFSRDGQCATTTLRSRLTSEIGDMLWYLSQLYNHSVELGVVIDTFENDHHQPISFVDNREEIQRVSRLVWGTIERLDSRFITDDIALCLQYVIRFCSLFEIDVVESANLVLKKLRGRYLTDNIQGDGEGVNRDG